MKLPLLHKSATRVLRPSDEDSQRQVAQQRAGTLMGGEAAGGQGEVRIWAPEQKAAKAAKPRSGRAVKPLIWSAFGFFLAALLVVFVPLPRVVIWSVLGILYAASFLAFKIAWRIMDAIMESARAVFFACYLSTDNAGLSFATRHAGGLSMPWSEIVGIRRTGYNFWLHTRSSGAQQLSLAGFSRRDTNTLFFSDPFAGQSFPGNSRASYRPNAPHP